MYKKEFGCLAIINQITFLRQKLLYSRVLSIISVIIKVQYKKVEKSINSNIKHVV